MRAPNWLIALHAAALVSILVAMAFVVTKPERPDPVGFAIAVFCLIYIERRMTWLAVDNS